MFADIDDDNSGTIDKREMAKALKVLRIDVSSREIDDLFRRFDTDGDGRMGYTEYLAFLGFNKEVARRGSIMIERKSELQSLVDRIRLKIEDNLGSGAQSGSRIKEVFAEIDDDKSGTIDKQEMTKALKVLRVDVSSREIDDLFREYDKDGDGRLGYSEYLQLLGFNSANAPTASKTASSRTLKRGGEEELDSLVNRIRLKIENNLGSQAQSAGRVKEVFADIDADRSGSIDKRELMTAMKTLRIDVSSQEMDDLFHRFDTDGDGRLGYAEYLQLLGFNSANAPTASKTASSRTLKRGGEEELDSLVNRIRLKIENNLGSQAQSAGRVKEVFADIDADRSGSIDKRELMTAMKTLRIDVSSQEMDDLFHRFDTDGDGRLGYAEYLQLLGFNSANAPTATRRR